MGGVGDVWGGGVMIGVKGGEGQGAQRKLRGFNNFETFLALIYFESNDTFDFFIILKWGEGGVACAPRIPQPIPPRFDPGRVTH